LYQITHCRNHSLLAIPTTKAGEYALSLAVDRFSDKHTGSKTKSQSLDLLLYNDRPMEYEENLLIGSYFDDTEDNAKRRHRKVRRLKKLTNFFGDRSAFQSEFKTQSLPRPVGVKHKSQESTSGETDSSSDEESNDVALKAYQRKKKADKLEEFFGASNFPQIQVADADQNESSAKVVRTSRLDENIDVTYVGSNDDSSIDANFSDPKSMNENELSTDMKRILTIRSKKLKTMLGETLNESTVRNSVMKGLKRSPSTEDPVNPREAKSETKEVAYDARTARRVSSASVASSERRHERKKNRRRKRLEKLQQFLGQDVNAETLDQLDLQYYYVNAKSEVAIDDEGLWKSDRGLEKLAGNTAKAPETRLVQLKRAKKLQHFFFGQTFPSNAVTGNPKFHDTRNSILGLDALLDKEEGVEQLIQELQIIDSKLEAASSHDMAETTGISSNSGSSNDHESDAKERKHSKKIRQARHKKLQQFFGAESISPEQLIDQKILRELESQIQESKISNEEKEELQQEVERLRNKLHRRSIEIEQKNWLNHLPRPAPSVKLGLSQATLAIGKSFERLFSGTGHASLEPKARDIGPERTVESVQSTIDPNAVLDGTNGTAHQPLV
jgi:hypothetical protein